MRPLPDAIPSGSSACLPCQYFQPKYPATATAMAMKIHFR
jgi:hypothetical protein